MEHYIGIIIVVIVLAIVVVRSRLTHFECPNCGHSFKVSTLKYILTPHAGLGRYVTCPKCQTRGLLVPQRDKE